MKKVSKTRKMTGLLTVLYFFFFFFTSKWTEKKSTRTLVGQEEEGRKEGESQLCGRMFDALYATVAGGRRRAQQYNFFFCFFTSTAVYILIFSVTLYTESDRKIQKRRYSSDK